MHSSFFNCSTMGLKLTLWMTLIKYKKSGPHVSFYFCRLEVIKLFNDIVLISF